MIKSISFDSNLTNIWNKCLGNNDSLFPFSAYDWHRIYFDTIGTKYKPLILYAPDLNTIAPFAQNDQELIFSGGYEVSDYCDLIGPENNKPSAWAEIISYLKTNNYSNLILNNIPESSTTLSYFQNLAQTDNRIQIVSEDTTPIIKLPDNYADYLSTLDRKSRHEMLRKTRKFEREFPNFQIITNQNPKSDLQNLFTLMRLDEDKRQFLTSDMENFFIQICNTFQPSTNIQSLWVDEKPAAVNLAFTLPKTFLLYNSGFDNTRFSGAGFYLKTKSIQYAIEHQIADYNFLQGNERYKYELGGQDFFVYRSKFMLQ
jgi:hypothetical protein